MCWVHVIEADAVDGLLASDLLVLVCQLVIPGLSHVTQCSSGRVKLLKKAEIPRASKGNITRAPIMYCSRICVASQLAVIEIRVRSMSNMSQIGETNRDTRQLIP